MKNKLIRYLIIMFFAFMADSLMRYYLPSSITKQTLTIVSYAGLIMFNLLNNTIDEDHRYFFALVCGIYYTVIYGNSMYIYALLFLLYSVGGKLYMKRAKFTYLEALATVILTIFIHESVVYLLMWMTQTTRIAIYSFMLNRLAPTILLNIVVFNVVYYIHNIFKIEGDVDVYFH